MTTQTHREYARWRSRQIAYGRWQPWTPAAPVREHVHQLRARDTSYYAIAKAAGVSPMMVYRLQRGQPGKDADTPDRIRTTQANRLLAVTPATLSAAAGRCDATGTRRRLQALVAMGHPAINLARELGLPPHRTWAIIRGDTVTVAPQTHAAVCDLYDQLWDLRPPEHTPAERRTAVLARARARRNGWPTPMGLDDEHIDDPAYQPRTAWRPATGTGVTAPPLRTAQHQAQSSALSSD